MNNNQIDNDTDESTRFLRWAITGFLILVLIVFTSFSVLYTMHDISIKYYLYLCTLQHIIWLLGFIYFKHLNIETLIIMYLSYILVTVYPFACIYWNSKNPVAFFWFILPIIGSIAFNIRHIVLWIFLTLITTVSVFFTCCLFPQIDIPTSVITIYNGLTIISVVVLTGFFAIVYTKNRDIANTMNAAEENKKEDDDDNKNDENEERYKELYNNIITYLEQNKAFKNPKFNAMILAKELNSNVSYISKAIKAGDNDNFNALLNYFRVNYAKSMLDSEDMKKYTIDYVCTEAGYKYRSTFNTAFKNIMGMTPSDYLSLKNTDYNS